MRFKPGFCRICDHPISPFMDFGDMPIGNGFLSLDGFETEYFLQDESSCLRKMFYFSGS